MLESCCRENDAAITVSALQRGALWSPRAFGGANSAEDAVLETSGRENDSVFTVSESRGLHNIAEEAVLETCGRENDAVLTVSESSRSWKDAVSETCGRENFAVLTVSESSRSVKAGEIGKFGLLEVITSDFSSPLAHSMSLSNSSRVSSHVGCTALFLPSASACALAACSHGSCSAPSTCCSVVHACW